MPGLIQGFELARRALLAHQSALTVTGHNIANVSTPGFTRRRVLLGPTPAERTPDGVLGSGVKLDGVLRRRDIFLDAQIRSEKGLAGRWQARSESLEKLEVVLNEPSDLGLGHLLDQFWNAWLDLSNNPEDLASRTVVVQKGVSLSDGFRNLDTRFRSQLQASEGELEQRVLEINNHLDEIAHLNSQLDGRDPLSGDTADQRDRRDLLLDELAREAGATQLIRPDGSAVVRLGGRTVVQGTNVSPLAVQRFSQDGESNMRVVFSDGAVAQELSGRLGGLIEVREAIIPVFRDDLDALAKALADSVNQLHQAGPSRQPFFRGQSARDLEVANELIQDASQVNAGSSGDPGDNDIALAVAALRDARILARGTATPGSFYGSRISQLGTLREQARFFDESQEAAVASLEAQRQAVIGVNLDEELTRLVETQRAYQAAARLFTIVGEMYEDLLQI